MDRPKKNIFAYILPFLIIAFLVAMSILYLKGSIDIGRLFEVIKTQKTVEESKLTMIFQKGQSKILRWGTEEWDFIEEDTPMSVGDTLRTAVEGRMVLRFFNHNEVRLSGNTEVKLLRIDRSNAEGSHIALELVSGQAWARIPASKIPNSDFIINTANIVAQVTGESVFNIIQSGKEEEGVYVIGGNVKSSVSRTINGRRFPIDVYSLTGAEQVVLNEVTFAKLENDQTDVVTTTSSEFEKSDWYIWNIEKEKALGFLIDPETVQKKITRSDLEELEEEFVTITRPRGNQVVGAQVLVRGTYNPDKINKILVNGKEAAKGDDGTWEISVIASSTDNTLLVTAIDFKAKEWKAFDWNLNVKDKGPEILTVTDPEVDENGNARHDNPNLELQGEVSSDAVRVCIQYREEEPYCLKQFKPGNTTWRYVAAVKYENFGEGQNRYIIRVYDDFNNVTTKTVYIFHNVEKPTSKIEESITLIDDKPKEVEIFVPSPKITAPTASGRFELNQEKIFIAGEVEEEIVSVLINNKRADLNRETKTFGMELFLNPGENLIKATAVDNNGTKSNATLLRVIYTPLDDIVNDQEE